jgi:hypothetical protein
MTTPKAPSFAPPIPVDMLPASSMPFRGRVGMTFAPGRRVRGASPDWDRDLDEDLRVLRDVHGTRVLVTLVREYELDDLGIPALFERMVAFGLERPASCQQRRRQRLRGHGSLGDAGRRQGLAEMTRAFHDGARAADPSRTR